MNIEKQKQFATHFKKWVDMNSLKESSEKNPTVRCRCTGQNRQRGREVQPNNHSTQAATRWVIFSITNYLKINN